MYNTWKVSLETTPGQFGTDKVIRDERNTYIAQVRSAGMKEANLIALAPRMLAVFGCIYEQSQMAVNSDDISVLRDALIDIMGSAGHIIKLMEA
jgi:hypothetical protein